MKQPEVSQATHVQEIVVQLRLGRGRGPVDMHGAKLAGADLSGLDLSGSSLADADLTGCDVSTARFKGTDLRRAKLDGARLDGADFTGADLTGATLTGAKGSWAMFDDARLTGASLAGAKLQGPSFVGSDLSDATLTDALLQGARARGANLSGANLRGATLRDADLREVNVERAIFDDADLRSSRIANLRDYRAASWLGTDVRDVGALGAELCLDFARAQNRAAELEREQRSPAMVRWTACAFIVLALFAVAYHQGGMSEALHTGVSSVLLAALIAMFVSRRS